MISKKEYEKLRDKFMDMYDPVEGAITYHSKEDNGTVYSIYNAYSDEDILDLLEDKEFVNSLSVTELGFLVKKLDIEVPDTFDDMYRTLCQMTLTLQLLPEISNKIHVSILYWFYEFTFRDISIKVTNCYNIGLYREELIEKAKYIFYDELSTIRCLYYERNLKELDTFEVIYEDYAITIEHIVSWYNYLRKDNNKREYLYWKDAVARHLTKELADELYHL